MELQVSSFFNQTWQDCTLEQFINFAQPTDDELPEMLEAMESGEHVLSALMMHKFRAKPPDDTISTGFND